MKKRFYAGDQGPFIYDTTDTYRSGETVFQGEFREAFASEGQGRIVEAPTHEEHLLRLQDLSGKILGTPNEINVTEQADGSIVISLPSDIKIDDVGNITAVNSIQFNTIPVHVHAEGAIHWDDDDKTLNIDTEVEGTAIQVGQEQVIRCKNSGGDIANGDVVFVSGASGKRPEITIADADSADSHKLLGVCTNDIQGGQIGYVTTQGIVRDIDTSAWAAGTILYLSQTGTTGNTLTNTAPTPPAHSVCVALVLWQHASEGMLCVRPSVGADVNELHDVKITGIAANQILARNPGNTLYENYTPTVDVPIVLSSYDPEPGRAAETNIHGGISNLAGGQPLDSVPTDIVVSKGTGKILVVVNAGSDISGTITVTGDTVDRETGAVTVADTDTIVVDTLTTDNSATDSNGNTKHAFEDAYITSKWFTGTVTLSTADLTLTDVDVYHVSFDQLNDLSDFVLNTFDVSLYTTNVNAEFDGYVFTLHVTTGDKCDIHLEAELHIGADGETAIANRYWRLRKGNIDDPIDGTTDGFWIDAHYSNSPSYIEDVTIKVWFTKSQSLTLT